MVAVCDPLASLQAPVLWLGALGFDPGERRRLEHLVSLHQGEIHWKFGKFAEADAWLINGARTRTDERSHIRIAPGLPSERNMRLALTDVTRPCAFAAPLPHDFEPLCQFDASCAASIEGLLQQLATWLQPLRSRVALGAEIMRRAPWMPRAVFHLHLADRLLAVVDLVNGRVGFAPGATPHLLASATWAKRPPSAGVFPAHFIKSTVPQLAWSHVRHSDRDWLPSRYAHRPVHYRGAPRVPLEWLSDSQLLLLQELRTSCASLRELAQGTGLTPQQVRGDLACLYVSGAITTSPARAANPTAASVRRDAVSSTGYSSSLLDARIAEHVDRVHTAGRSITVPAPLTSAGT